jgi:predicted alpha/beta hydrolase
LPIFYKLTGGLPSWVLGAEYLPKQVARDWSRFGRKKPTLPTLMASHYEKASVLIKVYSMADDKRFAPPNCVRELEKLYHNADTDIQTFHPKD